MKSYIFAAVVMSVAATPAFAKGAYVQVQGGYDKISVAGSSADGIAYGVAAGYDFALSDKAFIGVEASLDDSSTKECESDILALGDRLCALAGRDIAAVARLGYNLSEASQLYVLAGYTNARLKVTYDDGISKASVADNGDGFRVGAGYKHNFGEKLFGKLEYRYSNYEADFSRNQVLAAIGVNF